MQKVILGISGSPRKQATEHVLSEALNTMEEKGYETELFTVRGKDISPCRNCDYCLRKKECIVQDDMYQLYPIFKDVKGIIMATPIYNGGVSAQIKAVMDRTRAAAAVDLNFLKHKVGMAIAVGGDRVGGQELAIQQIMTFYILNGAIPVSGGPFGSNLGANFWSQDSLKGVKEDEEGFRSLKKTLNRFQEFLEIYQKD
ncbi:flavodoxin family protein [uncultured Methanobacterium sp.]|uniref:flavodoxin family protein n=1 Tax=uncultured Methanobacterium sp. TaxID=176306 RepID=UPI002AA68E74|nr:flavodoxin family protein [uncultured Methanobacterium sp.]